MIVYITLLAVSPLLIRISGIVNGIIAVEPLASPSISSWAITFQVKVVAPILLFNTIATLVLVQIVSDAGSAVGFGST